MKRFLKTSAVAAAVAAATLATSAAHAIPIAVAGTEGYSIIVGSTGEVVATYLGNTADYSNDLLLNGIFIFNNKTTPVGSSVSLGMFDAGTELIFQLHVNNTGDNFFSGAASRNPLNVAHARVQANWMSDTTLVSFEDKLRGPYAYNDLSFSFTNTASALPQPVSEPASLALVLAGLGMAGAVTARKRKSLDDR